MLNHGVSTGGLFLIVGMLSDRRHTRLIAEFGGLKKVMPRLVGGVPDRHAVVDRAARAERLRRRVPDPARRVPLESAAGGVRGDRRDPVGDLHAVDVPARELRAGDQREERGAAGSRGRASGRCIVPIVALAVLMGVLPNLFLRPMEPSVERLLEPVQQSAPARIQARTAAGLEPVDVAGMRPMMSVLQRDRADGLRHRGRHRRDDRRGVPRAGRADADRRRSASIGLRRRGDRVVAALGPQRRQLRRRRRRQLRAVRHRDPDRRRPAVAGDLRRRPSSASGCRAASTTR